jgi:uncharacterized protein YggE
MKPAPLLAAALSGALVVLAVVAIRGAGAPEAAQAASGQSSGRSDMLAPYLRFTGEGSVTARPDTADLSLTVSNDAATSQAALAGTTSRMAAVIAAMRADGVAADDMQTGDVSSWQDWEAPHRWHASNTLTVTLHDPSKAGSVLSDASHAGADEVSGPSFSLTDQHAATRQALRFAVADARAKADAAAAAMGVHVTGVISVSDQAPVQLEPFGVMAMASGAAVRSPSVPVQTGTQTVTSDVVVVFSYGA